MDVIPQGEALALVPLGTGETARLFPAARFGGLDCLAATFRSHAYAPHQHDTYVIGTIEAGCETFRIKGVRHYARPGQIAFVNPLETHDGEPHGAGYAYRMTYPEVGLMQELAGSLAGRSAVSTPHFPEPLVEDPQGAALFAAAHRRLEQEGDALAGEEMLVAFYARCLKLHAGWAELPLGIERGPVGRARQLFEDRFDEDLSLADVAAFCGLTRHHLIRAFRRETGLTPHAYLVDIRVRRAKEALRRGETPGAAAAATGFCDQAHLTRAFKARLGVTPGAFRAAHHG